MESKLESHKISTQNPFSTGEGKKILLVVILAYTIELLSEGYKTNLVISPISLGLSKIVLIEELERLTPPTFKEQAVLVVKQYYFVQEK